MSEGTLSRLSVMWVVIVILWLVGALGDGSENDTSNVLTSEQKLEMLENNQNY